MVLTPNYLASAVCIAELFYFQGGIRTHLAGEFISGSVVIDACPPSHSKSAIKRLLMTTNCHVVGQKPLQEQDVRRVIQSLERLGESVTTVKVMKRLRERLLLAALCMVMMLFGFLSLIVGQLLSER